MFRSESPSQVFRLTLHWLFEILSPLPQEKWSEVIPAYDNMCQLNGLKAAQKPLPLEPPFDKMWHSIEKVCNMQSSYVHNLFINMQCGLIC